MATRRPVQRIECVIDGSNLFVALRRRRNPTRLHYTGLGIAIAKCLPHDLRPWVYSRTVYVTASPREQDGRDRFRRWREFQAMLCRTDRLAWRLGRLEGPAGRTYEKGVDAIVTTRLLAGAFKDDYDIALLVSADGDYAAAIEEVRHAGKRVYVAFFGGVRSHHLDRAADGFIDLETVDITRLKYFGRRRRETRPG